MGIIIKVNGQPVTILEASLKLEKTADPRSTCSFAPIDPTGTLHFESNQKVEVSDDSGILFAGVINDVTENNLYPNPHIKSVINAVDNRYKADNIYCQRDYENRYAGEIAADLLNSYLAAEGITAPAAVRRDTTTNQLAQGALSNTIATNNVGDGDLELAPAGADVTITDDFTTGTPTNVTASGGSLQATHINAIKLTGTMNVPGISNAAAFYKISTPGYTVQSTDLLTYYVWVDKASPEIKATVDVVCTDGTRLQDLPGDVGYADLNDISPGPNNDLAGYADGQWYYRAFSIDLSQAGKSIAYISVALGGQQVGNYTAYFRNINIVDFNTGNMRKAIFNGTLAISPQQLQTTGYKDVSLSIVPTYDLQTYQSIGFPDTPITFIDAPPHVSIHRRVSTAYSLDTAKLLKNSVISWQASEPEHTKLTIRCALDNGTPVECINNAPLPNLVAGMNLTGRSLSIYQDFYLIDGTSPEIAPVLNALEITVQSAPSATKTDASYITTFASGESGASFSSTIGNSGILNLTGATRDWDQSIWIFNYSGQDKFLGTAGDSIFKRAYEFGNPSAGNESKTRFTFAGQHQNFVAEVDVQIKSDISIGLFYRSTNLSSSNGAYAYAAMLSATGILLKKGTNTTGGGSSTSLQSVSFTLQDNSWHRLKVVVSGSSHSIFLDDVLQFAKTDSSFSAIGYVGVIGVSPSLAFPQFNFDNFGVMDALSGTWTSPNISLNSVANYGNSYISWRDRSESPSSNNTVKVEYSINGGSTWVICTNEAALPGLSAGQSLTGMNLKLRVTLSSTTAQSMPGLDNLSILVVGAYSASGYRISPALSLVQVRRLGNSLTAWNATLPTGAALDVSASTNNGVSWQACTNGGPIPGLVGQSQPSIDTFDSDTSANFTSTSIGTGSSNTLLSLSAPTQVGMNYYHESMGYIGRTNAQISQDLANIAKVCNKLKIYLNPLPQNAGTVSHTSAVAICTNICQMAKAAGFYVVWEENIDQSRVLTDSTTDLSTPSSYKWKWADYAAQVVADAALAQAAGADEYVVGNEIIGSTHYYSTDPGTNTATAIYNTANFPTYVSALVDACRANFSGQIAYQEVNTVSSMWAPGGTMNLHSLDKIYFDVYEKWTNFQTKLDSLASIFGSHVEIGEVSSIAPLGTIGFYAAYTEDDWSRELMRRYDYLRQKNIPFYCFTYGDPSSSSNGFGLRTNASGNNSFHDVWNYLIRTKSLSYNTWFYDLFPPNDFIGGSGGSGGEVGVDSTHTTALATAQGTDYMFRGRAIHRVATGSYRIVAKYTDANNYYCINVDVINNQIKFIRRLAGVETQLGATVPWPPHNSFAGSLSGSTFTYFDFEIRMSGTGANTSVWAAWDTYKIVDMIDTGNTSLNSLQFGMLYVNMAANMGRVINSSPETQPTSTPANWTWETANSRVVANGGQDALLLLKGLSTLPAEITFDMDRSDAGGIVFGVVDTLNFCRLSIHDADSPTSPNTLQLAKIQGGTATAIGTNTPINFPRGKLLRFRTRIVEDGLITVYIDGQQVAEYTDPAPFSGQVGLYNDTVSGESSSRYYNLRVQPLGDDVSAVNVITKWVLSSIDPAVTPQVQDIVTSAYSAAITTGAFVPQAQYSALSGDGKTVAAALDDLAAQSNGWWKIDENLKPWFQDRNATPAPWLLTSEDMLVSKLELSVQSDMYRNDQWITGGYDIVLVQESRIGDGTTQSWQLTYAVDGVTSILLNNQLVTFGIKDVNSGRAFYYTPGDKTLAQDSSGNVLSRFQSFTIVYYARIPIAVNVRNEAQIKAIQQAQGGTGPIQYFEKVDGLGKIAMLQLAVSRLQQYGGLARTLKFKTLRNGLDIGQLGSFFVPQHGLTDVPMLITDIQVYFQSAVINGQAAALVTYEVSATDGPILAAWKFLRKLAHV